MNEEFRGTSEVRIDRIELIEKLKSNRNNHSQLYNDAMEGYYVEAEKKLKSKINDIKNKKIVTSFSIDVPKDHTKDYDRLISMLEMSKDSELVLSSSEFNKYVLDEWISVEEKTMLRAMAMSSTNSALYK